MRAARLLLLAPLALAACRKDSPAARRDDPANASAPLRACDPLPSAIATRLEIGPCALAVPGKVSIVAGGSLVLAAGTQLAFAKGARIELDDGALIAQGTADAHVVATAADSDGGLRLYDGTGALSYVDVEGATQLTVGRGTTNVSIDHLHAKEGTVVDVAAVSFARFEAVEADGELRVAADAIEGVASIDARAPIHVQGKIAAKTRWPHVSQPIAIRDDVSVDPTGALTIEAGNVLVFDKDGQLAVRGVLVASKVTFRGSDTTSKPPRWKGVTFAGPIPAGSSITDASFEGAGVHVYTPRLMPSIERTSFRDAADPAIDLLSGDCANYDATHGNTAIGGSLCSSAIDAFLTTAIAAPFPSGGSTSTKGTIAPSSSASGSTHPKP